MFDTVHNRNLVWNGTEWVPETQPGGGSGGAVTIADGADVAEGSTADAAWSGSGAGTVVSVLKKIATGGAGGGPATIADGADVAEGAKADAAATDSTSSWTVVSLLKGLFNKLSGTLAVSGPLTDTQLRATAVPVSGPLTDAQLRAAAVPVSLAAAPTTAVTIADGADVAQGAIADVAVAAGATGTISAKLRAISRDIISNIVLAAGTSLIGKVGIDQTTPGTTNAVAPISGQAGIAGNTGAVGATTTRVTVATDDPVLGGTADAAATAGGTGSIAAKLRAISRDLVANIVLAAGANLIGFVGGKNTYANEATITVTLTSLANTSKRESTAFFSTAYKDYQVLIQTKGQASGTAYLNLYVYEATVNGGVYTGNATGTDAGYTGVLSDTRFLGAILMNANTTAVQFSCRLSDIFATVPPAGGIIFDNESGAALSATGGDHIAKFSGIN